MSITPSSHLISQATPSPTRRFLARAGLLPFMILLLLLLSLKYLAPVSCSRYTYTYTRPTCSDPEWLPHLLPSLSSSPTTIPLIRRRRPPKHALLLIPAISLIALIPITPFMHHLLTLLLLTLLLLLLLMQILLMSLLILMVLLILLVQSHIMVRPSSIMYILALHHTPAPTSTPVHTVIMVIGPRIRLLLLLVIRVFVVDVGGGLVGVGMWRHCGHVWCGLVLLVLWLCVC